MRRFLVATWVVLILLAGSAAAWAAPAKAMLGKVDSNKTASNQVVLVLGDSLSAAHNIPVASGWVQLLGDRLDKMEPGWTVINASISGETSLSGRNRLPALLQKYHPRVVLLELGANDGLQGLRLAPLRDNLDAMIKAAQATQAKVLLLGIELPVNYGPQYRDGLRAVYVELAAQHKAALVPFLLEGVAMKPELMQDDGLHPLAASEPIVLETVWKALPPLLH